MKSMIPFARRLLAPQPKPQPVIDDQDQPAVFRPDLDRLPLVDRRGHEVVALEVVRAAAAVDLARRSAFRGAGHVEPPLGPDAECEPHRPPLSIPHVTDPDT